MEEAGIVSPLFPWMIAHNHLNTNQTTNLSKNQMRRPGCLVCYFPMDHPGPPGPQSVIRGCKSSPWLGVEQVGVPLAESSYFATFTDSSCCVTLSASVLALSANKIQKVTIMFALFQHVQLF